MPDSRLRWRTSKPASGIPRESVRRKIDTLVDRGWGEKVEAKGVRITESCVEHCATPFNLLSRWGFEHISCYSKANLNLHAMAHFWPCGSILSLFTHHALPRFAEMEQTVCP